LLAVVVVDAAAALYRIGWLLLRRAAVRSYRTRPVVRTHDAAGVEQILLGEDGAMLESTLAVPAVQSRLPAALCPIAPSSASPPCKFPATFGVCICRVEVYDLAERSLEMSIDHQSIEQELDELLESLKLLKPRIDPEFKARCWAKVLEAFIQEAEREKKGTRADVQV
jgi:hypothetical protein